jgi:hypothetical protein
MLSTVKKENSNYSIKIDDLSPPKPPLPSSASTSTQIEKMYICNICNIETNSQLVLEDHFRGQRHLKKLMNNHGISSVQANNSSTTQMKSNDQTIIQQSPLPNKSVIKKTGTFCEICNVECSSESTYKQHILGQKHLKKLKISQMETSKDAFKCHVCLLDFVSLDQLQLHQTGKKHKKKAKLQLPTNEPTNLDIKMDNSNANSDLITIDNDGNKSDVIMENSATNSDTKIENNYINPCTIMVNNEVMFYRCEICDLTALTQSQLDTHLNGKKHLKKLKQLSGMVAQNQTIPKKAKKSNPIFLCNFKPF